MRALFYDESQGVSVCMFWSVESRITSSKPPKECSAVSIATVRKFVELDSHECGWALSPFDTSYIFFVYLYMF